MYADVIEINENKVTAQTDVGLVCGYWCSNVLVEHKKYDLELDCDDVITEFDINFSSNNKDRIECLNESINLYGYVEEYEDNILFLRLNQEIIMLETSSNFDFSKFINNFVCINIQQINLYDKEIL